jgi:hypothetical protein
MIIITLLFLHEYEDEDLLIIQKLGIDYWVCILLNIVISFGFCLGLVIQKNLMEIHFFKPYKLLLYKSSIGIMIIIVSLIITSNVSCEKLNIVDSPFIRIHFCFD